MKIPFSLIFAALLVTPAWAQNLTKIEAGNIALGQCYQNCGEPVWEGAKGEIEHDKWFVVLLHDASWSGILGTDAFDVLSEWDDEMRCAAVVNAVNEMNFCQLKCRDLERIYPQSSTLSKARFNAGLTAGTTILENAGIVGLTYGTDEFSAACQTMLYGSTESQSRAREGASSLGSEDRRPPSIFSIIQND